MVKTLSMEPDAFISEKKSISDASWMAVR